MDRVHQLLDLLACGGAPGDLSLAGARGADYPLDQLDGVVAVQLLQVSGVSIDVEWRRQRLAAGKDHPRVAQVQEPFAQGKDGSQLLARLLRKGFGRLLLHERW